MAAVLFRQSAEVSVDASWSRVYRMYHKPGDFQKCYQCDDGKYYPRGHPAVAGAGNDIIDYLCWLSDDISRS